VEIIVNGQPVTVPVGPIRDVIAAAIQQAGQIGAPIDQWVLRTTDGEIIPHALPGGVEYALTGGQRLWLHLGLEPVPASPPTREGWQPIETAPKDGTPVLLAHGKAHRHVSFCTFSDGCWYQCWDGEVISRNITHWMPLPPAPAVSPAPPKGEA
jgi:hypothetical protein